MEQHLVCEEAVVFAFLVLSIWTGEVEKTWDGCNRLLQNDLPFDTDCTFFLSPGKARSYAATNIHSDYNFVSVAVIMLNDQI